MLEKLLNQIDLDDLKANLIGHRQSTDKIFLMLRQIEAHFKAKPDKTLLMNNGVGTLVFRDQKWQTGRFWTPTLAHLKSKLTLHNSSRYQFDLFLGGHPLTDIGSLQSKATLHSLFQVASQFNALESPGPFISPITRYLSDPTQGPRAAISAFPGTFHRHYMGILNQGSYLPQTDDNEVNFLGSVLSDEFASVNHGYLSSETIFDPQACLDALTVHFDEIQVGVQSETEVALGYNWTGKVQKPVFITQVLTSTLAAGDYSPDIDIQDPVWRGIMQQLLRAAYLGTLMVGVLEKKTNIVLTPIGGGVFGNPSDLIWDAIFWALDEVTPYLEMNTQVVLNSYIWGHDMLLEKMTADINARHGKVIHF